MRQRREPCCIAPVQDERAPGLGVVARQSSANAAGRAGNENRGRTLPVAPADVSRPWLSAAAAGRPAC
jgi:hypothetical protein